MTSQYVDRLSRTDRDMILTLVPEGARVLDLGCGPGLYVHRLSAMGCECVGMDFSPASIRHASESAAADVEDKMQ